MIRDFEIVRIDTFSNNKNHKCFCYEFKLTDDEKVLKSEFDYYIFHHQIIFSQLYYAKDLGNCVFPKDALKEIVRITLSLPEFRLRHLVSPYTLDF